MGAAGSRAAALALACAGCTSIAPDARSLDGSRWRIVAVNGRPTPTIGDYRIEFRDGQMSGRFGCNSWGGHYAVAGDTVTAARIMSTMMACSDPAASFESAGLAVVRHPMRWKLAAGPRLTLGNRMGAIDLERLSK